MSIAGAVLRRARLADSAGVERMMLEATGIAAAALPRSFAANFRAAAVRLRRGDYDGARRYFRIAAQFEGRARPASWELAKLLLRLDREAMSPEARQALRADLVSALRRAADSDRPALRSEALLVLCNTLYERGQYTDARLTAELALAAKPGDPRVLLVQARIAAALGNFAGAEALYSNLLSQHPGNESTRRMHKILSAFGDDRRVSAHGAISQLNGQRQADVLVAVGSGLGDMVHVTPAIRNIARRTGKVVDVVVFGDHAHSGFLMENPEFVGSVWPLCGDILNRPYRSVLITNSFGPARFPFRADRVLWGREWNPFRPGGLHETILNLDAAKQLLGIPYEPADVSGYFVGNLTYRPPLEPVIGIHSGSKPGRWLTKRWPHFRELAARFRASGFRVFSVGTADEYVEGTEDRTGGSVEQMCRAMLDCVHFVSNDSGPMNIAAALGIPVTALFAPTNWRTRLPLVDTARPVASARDCSPCEVKDHAHFAQGLCRCIAGIEVAAVEGAVLERTCGARTIAS